MAKIKNKFNYLLAFAISALGISSNSAIADEPKQASSEDEAASEASGGLSAGAIAAAVAAAAAIAAVSDSDSSPAPTPAPTVIEEYNVSTTELVAVSTYTNTTSLDNTGTTTATREVAGTEEVTGVVTSTSTASSTSTIGGVVTDYRYALRAEAGPDSAWAAANPLNSNGEYYTPASDYNSTGQNADGDNVVYIAVDNAIDSNIEVISEAVAASEEVYVVDVIEAVPVTLPDTIYVEETTVSVATRTKLAD